MQDASCRRRTCTKTTGEGLRDVCSTKDFSALLARVHVYILQRSCSFLGVARSSLKKKLCLRASNRNSSANAENDPSDGLDTRINCVILQTLRKFGSHPQQQSNRVRTETERIPPAKTRGRTRICRCHHPFWRFASKKQ